MKPIKRFIAFALALLMLAGLPQVIFAAPKVGDVVDYVLHTDIVTYINGLPIRSYNIKGYTAVIVEDLSNYGFYVVWYGTERELTVRPLASGQLIGGYTPEKNTQPIGSKAMPVYFTDIVTYLDGESRQLQRRRKNDNLRRRPGEILRERICLGPERRTLSRL